MNPMNELLFAKNGRMVWVHGRWRRNKWRMSLNYTRICYAIKYLQTKWGMEFAVIVARAASPNQ